MISEKDWKNIQQIFAAAQKSSLHASIATVDPSGQPTITPIGTIFLNDNQTAYFFDTYTEKLSENLIQNTKACIQAINTNRWFWLKSLIKGHFDHHFGVRLYVEIGDLRPATEQEKRAVDQRTKPLQWTKGSQLIWSEFTHVREFKINTFRWVKYPRMMAHLT
ncbi:pyridoxamine 5'-phosphate oxidase family protein [Acinetobacter sp. Ac_5812]|uniref:pyridoxamine 5'-phosphate oxidase family protein n=1 Tax=Acinetobacter sp. Ac_5812 TaxID=1848937 RepID=UPI0014904022|nr:pyridoxamine 5'-phosphate oxidase family protein [Acinetobacter sp. Ac_5812]NNP69912.1 pyridoxamine 5'-phosphate oxidase [Acinetobacter sp. Ac_5812]